MISFFKKKEKVDETGLESFLWTLIIKKSPLIKEYAINDTNRKTIIEYKYELSKCDPIVYHFVKYCSENLSDITIEHESVPMSFPYGDWVYTYDIFDGSNGFSFYFTSNKAYVRIKTDIGWVLHSTNKEDYNLLADVYRSVKNSKDIDERIKKQNRISLSIETYKSKYGG